MITFCSPPVASDKLQEEVVVPLVADVRDLELSRHPILEGLRPSLADFCTQARGVAQRLAQHLPPQLRTPPAEQMPSFWDCYCDQFARFSIAPALVNYEIARRALAGGAQLAVLREKRDSAWWRDRIGGYEAVSAASQQAGIPLRARPGGLWQGTRSLVLPLLSWGQALLTVANSYGSRSASGLQRLSADDCDVLFLAVGATSAPIIARLAQDLSRRHQLKSVAVDLHFGGSTQALADINIPAVSADPRCYGGRLIRAACANWSAWWGRFREAFDEAQDEFDGRRWLVPLLERRLMVKLAGRAALGLAELRAAQVIIERLSPRVVVGFHLYADMLAPLMLTAHQRGVVTVCCQHGIRGPYHRTLGNLPWDKLLVFGQYTADLLADLLEPTTEIQITGHSLYDETAAQPQPDEASALHRRLTGDSKFLVLVPTQPDEAEARSRQERWWLEGVGEACYELGAAMVVKLHPADRMDRMYRQLSHRLGQTVTILPYGNYDLADLIPACDLLVMRYSTVGYEANLCGKPVITVNLSGQHDRLEFAAEGGAQGVYRYENIKSAIRELLTDGSAREKLAWSRAEFLDRHLGPRDGRATERIAQAIAQAAEG